MDLRGHLRHRHSHKVTLLVCIQPLNGWNPNLENAYSTNALLSIPPIWGRVVIFFFCKHANNEVKWLQGVKCQTYIWDVRSWLLPWSLFLEVPAQGVISHSIFWGKKKHRTHKRHQRLYNWSKRLQEPLQVNWAHLNNISALRSYKSIKWNVLIYKCSF